MPNLSSIGLVVSEIQRRKVHVRTCNSTCGCFLGCVMNGCMLFGCMPKLDKIDPAVPEIQSKHIRKHPSRATCRLPTSPFYCTSASCPSISMNVAIEQ